MIFNQLQFVLFVPIELLLHSWLGRWSMRMSFQHTQVFDEVYNTSCSIKAAILYVDSFHRLKRPWQSIENGEGNSPRTNKGYPRHYYNSNSHKFFLPSVHMELFSLFCPTPFTIFPSMIHGYSTLSPHQMAYKYTKQQKCKLFLVSKPRNLFPPSIYTALSTSTSFSTFSFQGTHCNLTTLRTTIYYAKLDNLQRFTLNAIVMGGEPLLWL